MTHRCLDDEALAAWFDGLLSVDETDALMAAAASCPACARLLAEVGSALSGFDDDLAAGVVVPAAVTARAVALRPDAPTAATLGVMQIAVRWFDGQLAALADALAPGPMVAMAARGAAVAEESLRYALELGACRVAVTIDALPDARVDVGVEVEPAGAGFEVRLSQAGSLRAVAALRRGEGCLPSLAAGEYALVLRRDGDEIGQIALSIEVAADRIR